MSVRMGMFPPPNVGAVPGQMQPAPNPFAPLPPMPLAGMPPPPPMMGGMPPPPMGGMQPPPMGPTGPMGAGLGAPPSGQMPQQASNAPRRRQFGDYLENQLSGPSVPAPAPVQRSAPQNSFNGPMSSMDIFGGQPMPRPMQQQRPLPRPMMGGNMVQGYDKGGEAAAPAAPTGVDKVLVEKYGYEFEDGKAYAPGKTPSALAAANPSGLSTVEQGLVGTGEWTDAGDGVIMSPGGLLYDHEAGDTFSDRLVSGLGADQLGSDVTEYMAPPDERLSKGSVLQLVTGPNGQVSVVNTSGKGISFSDIYSGNSNSKFAEQYSDYLTGDGPLANINLSYGTEDEAMALLDTYGYEYGGNYVAPTPVAPTPVAPAPVPVAAPVVPEPVVTEPVVPVEEPVVPAAVDSYSVPAAYVPPSVSTGAPTGTYTAAPLPPNANETINYDQFDGDVGQFSNTGENFSLFGPKLNIPPFNSQYITSPVTGNMTTTNGPNMTAVSGIGALNMPASPVDIDILDWLSQPSYGTFNKPANFGVQFKNQGGVVPRSTEIAGQPHMLAYINPEEEGMLQDYRQDAPTVPGPGGIPAYAHNAFHAADAASMASYNKTFADTPGTVANKNKVKEMQAKRRKERADAAAAARAADAGLGRGAGAPSLESIKDRIARAEGTSGPEAYNTILGNQQNRFGVVPSAMSVEDVLAFQGNRGPGSYASYSQGVNSGRGVTRPSGAGVISTPVGKYQVVGSTLQALVDQGVISSDDMYNAATQEKIGDYLVNTDLAGGKGLEDYLAGNMTAAEFETALGKQFEGIERGLDGPVLASNSLGFAPTPASAPAPASSGYPQSVVDAGADLGIEIVGSNPNPNSASDIQNLIEASNNTNRDVSFVPPKTNTLQPTSIADFKGESDYLNGLDQIAAGQKGSIIPSREMTGDAAENFINNTTLDFAYDDPDKLREMSELYTPAAIQYYTAGSPGSDGFTAPMYNFKDLQDKLNKGETLTAQEASYLTGVTSPDVYAEDDKVTSTLRSLSGLGAVPEETVGGPTVMTDDSIYTPPVPIVAGNEPGMGGGSPNASTAYAGATPISSVSPVKDSGYRPPPNAQESAYIQNLLGNFEFDENGKMIMADPGLIERVLDSLGSNFTLGQFSLSDYKRRGIQDALDAYKATGEFVYDGGDLVGVRGSDGGVESYGTNIFETNAGDDTGSGGSGGSGGSSGPDEVEQNWTIGGDGVVVCNDEGWIYDAETGMCAAPSADAGSGSESPSLNIPQARSFDDIMASIQRAPTKPIASLASGGMAGLNKTADNFLRALGG